MWLNKHNIEAMAYWFCMTIEDRPGIRKYITDPYWAYYYCLDVKDRPEIRKYVSDGDLILLKNMDRELEE